MAELGPCATTKVEQNSGPDTGQGQPTSRRTVSSDDHSPLLQLQKAVHHVALDAATLSHAGPPRGISVTCRHVCEAQCLWVLPLPLVLCVVKATYALSSGPPRGSSIAKYEQALFSYLEGVFVFDILIRVHKQIKVHRSLFRRDHKVARHFSLSVSLLYLASSVSSFFRIPLLLHS